jgi:hypothetical protein
MKSGKKWREFVLNLTSDQRRELFGNGIIDEPNNIAYIPNDFALYDKRITAIFNAVVKNKTYEEILKISNKHREKE